MKILDGKKLAKRIKLEIAQKVSVMDTKPALAVILVGDDPASHLYVKLKEKSCKQTGITFHKYLLDADANKQDIISVIEFLNNDIQTDGILLQLPLPNTKWTDEIINHIKPEKDADGFHTKTLANLLDGKESIIPGLAHSIVSLIEASGEELAEKSCAILCNNKIFAKPIEYLLKKKHVNTIVYSQKDTSLAENLKKADILIIAIGKKEFVKEDMIKDNAIIIDVGINGEGKNIVGDVDAKNLVQKTGYITPVPGGVGPMTVAMLLANVLKISQKKQETSE